MSHELRKISQQAHATEFHMALFATIDNPWNNRSGQTHGSFKELKDEYSHQD